ncbi:hypothetical protein HHK36_031856 [Tetracentron sinense]|uniref:Uncharacterized protein n=1 Tax=Tetracentron sinense TaxID=13715 RepID=A0A835CY67_TETSI|nr:hypothetical protein HHK36_031856 [Tetracentron sinense]
MFEIKDPAIKLFGRTIPLLETQIPAESGEKSDPECQILSDSEVMDACSETTKIYVEDPPAEESGEQLSPPFRRGPLNGNGTVLKFGPDVPLCESMDAVVNLGDQKRSIEMDSVACGENGVKPSSCDSSLTASTCQENELPKNVVQVEQSGILGCYTRLTSSQHILCSVTLVLHWLTLGTLVESCSCHGRRSLLFLNWFMDQMAVIPIRFNGVPHQWWPFLGSALRAPLFHLCLPPIGVACQAGLPDHGMCHGLDLMEIYSPTVLC